MSVTQKQWNTLTLRREAVQLNTLTTDDPVSARVGVVTHTLPKLNGSVQLQISVRTAAAGWQKRWFTSKTSSISVLDGIRRARVLKSFSAETAKDQLATIGKGFSANIGADPEIFAVNKQDVVIPAWEFLPAKAEGNKIFWDGFQGEFTTQTETCLAWFIDQVRAGMRQVHKAVPKGGKLALADVIEVPPTTLKDEIWDHVRLGCDPSCNAYNDAGQLDVDSRMLPIRFAGGHKHFQFADLKEEAAIRMVKALDAIWGVASVSMFDGLEHPLRRVYYGRAGEYRMPKHGLEYRTPSNAWLCHPAIAQLSWTLARQAVQIGQQDALGAWDASEREVRRVINELDVAGARKILKKNKEILKALMGGYYRSNHSRVSTERFEQLAPLAIKHGLRVILEGAFGVLDTPKDVAKNWMLDAPTDEDRWLNPTDEQRKENRWFLHSESQNKQWLLAAEAIERGEKI